MANLVAFTIRRPWPKRASLPATGFRNDGVRWRIRLYHHHAPMCAEDPPHKSGPFPWWRPSSYMSHWRLAGRDYYWPPLIVVWHRDPVGRYSPSCRTRRMRWHLHHWRIQCPPLQKWRNRRA